MKRLLFVFVAVCLALPCAIVLSACKGGSKGGNDSSPSVIGISLSDSVQKGQNLYYEYEYGQELSFVGNIKVYATYSDGTEKELGEEEYANVKLSYYVNEEERTDITSITVLDVGTYNLNVTYAQCFATISLEITKAQVNQIPASAVVVRDVGSQTLAGGGTFRYESGSYNFDGETPTFVSDKEVLVLNALGAPMLKDCIEGVFLLTQTQKAIYDSKTSDEKQQYLLELCQNGNRQITMNHDGPTDTAFYVFTNSESLRPNQSNEFYYAFAKIDDGNHEPYCTIPTSHITIQKGIFRMSEAIVDEADATRTFAEIVELMNVSASYTFGFYDGDYQKNGVTLSHLNELIDAGQGIITFSTDAFNYGDNQNSLSVQTKAGGYGSGLIKFMFKVPTVDSKLSVSDSGDSGVPVELVFAFDKEDPASDEYFHWNAYFEIDQNDTIPVNLVLNKGLIQLYTPQTSYDYNYGETISLCTQGVVENLVAVSGTVSATAAGNYTATYTLLDTDNYILWDYFGQQYENNVANIDWSITQKMAPYFDFEGTYNQNTIYSGDTTFAYVPGVHTLYVDFSAVDSEYVNYRINNTSDTIEFEVCDNAYVDGMVVADATNPLRAIVTINAITTESGDAGTFSIKLTISGDENFVDVEYYAYFAITPAQFSAEEKAVLEADLESSLTIVQNRDDDKFIVPSLPVVDGGVWKLHHIFNEYSYLYNDGNEIVETEDLIQGHWFYSFIPTDGCQVAYEKNVTITFISKMNEYDNVANDISSYTYDNEKQLTRFEDVELWFVVESPTNNYSNLGEWNLYDNTGILLTPEIDGSARYWEFRFGANDAGQHEYILRFDLDENYENRELYYGPEMQITLNVIEPSDLTEQQIAELLAEAGLDGNEKVLQISDSEDEYQNHHYKIGSNAIPTTSSGLGVWGLFAKEDGGDMSYNNAQNINEYYLIGDEFVENGGWYFMFSPDDEYINSLVIVVTELNITNA